jgi:hypothetical protein
MAQVQGTENAVPMQLTTRPLSEVYVPVNWAVKIRESTAHAHPT